MNDQQHATAPAQAPSDEEIERLALDFCGLEPLTDFRYSDFARTLLARYSGAVAGEADNPVGWLTPQGLESLGNGDSPVRLAADADEETAFTVPVYLSPQPHAVPVQPKDES